MMMKLFEGRMNTCTMNECMYVVCIQKLSKVQKGRELFPLFLCKQMTPEQEQTAEIFGALTSSDSKLGQQKEAAQKLAKLLGNNKSLVVGTISFDI